MSTGEIRRLFLEVLEIEPRKRSAFLESSGASSEVRGAVLTLLRHDSGGDSFLQNAVARELLPPILEGQRFGAYQLRELLGRGGMGAVFKAERTDGELRQVVAIKIVDRGWLAPQALERFRQERQILAGLVHPNIAQLLDGGTREDGIPYLVMEYVDGLRLDEYCAQHHLGIAQRLRVFLPLCDAVEYAHRRLVVHRDLKPSNVVVTSEGAPKLLDFGVAKAIDPAGGGQTQTLVLTPDFASPEQVRGEEVTTATDVYGLGAVLYHLATGRPPHPVHGLSPRELERAICEIGPARPSLYQADLKGDLENILLKALHPEPAHRYPSARELAEDIERFLEHRPVLATPQRWWYRARRFVQRHALASVAACLAGAAIIAGVGVSIYEARRAQQRFDQVRELANRFIFDFESSIRDVPGTLPARQMVAATARQYLQSLALDNRGDAGLTRELAESHYRLSRVEINAAQSEAALRDNEKAVALLRSVKADCCGRPADRLLFIRALTDLARHRQVTHAIDDALTVSTEALRIARGWVKQSPQQPEAQQAMTAALSTQGVNLQAAGKLTEARRTLAEAVDWGAQGVRRYPNDDNLAYDQARVTHFLGGVCLSLRDGEGARDFGRAAAESLGRLVERHPDNARWRNMHAMAVSTQAAGLSLLAEKDPVYWGQAVDSARQAYTLAKENWRRNPGSNDEADTASILAGRLASPLDRAGQTSEAERLLGESGSIIEELLRRDPMNRRYQRLRFSNRVLLGDMLMDHAVWERADRTLADAASNIEEFLRTNPSDMVALDMKVSTLADQTIIRRHYSQTAQARELCRRGLDISVELIRRDPAMEQSIGDLAKLRRQARELGVPDPTVSAGGGR